MSGPLMRLMKWAGFVLSVVACGWVAHGLMTQYGNSTLVFPKMSALFIAAFGCFAAVIGLALGWGLLLRGLLPTVRMGYSVRAYALSLPGKYLPGNVVHFGFRHWMGLRAGLSHQQLGFATLLESMILIAVALLMVGLAPMPRITTIFGTELPTGWAGCLLGIAAFVSAWMYTKRARALVHLCAYTGCAFLYFALTTLALATLLGEPESVVSVLSPVSLSWVAGFLVVGAPGGIGIRESVLFQTLAPRSAESVPAAIIVFRLTLIAADLGICAVAGLRSEKAR